MNPSPDAAAPDPAAEAEFETRRQRFLNAPHEGEDLLGAGAVLTLASGGDAAAANAILRLRAEWFKQPCPITGSVQRGECDFIAIKLCRAYYLFAADGRLEPDTLAAIRAFFLENDFSSIYQSENHALLFHTSRYLMAHAYRAETMQAYGATGAEIVAEDAAWLRRYLCYRASCGWGEFDSASYIAAVWECLACLFDFAPDPELSRLTGMMMDLRLADFAVDALDGMCGGANGRIYPAQALDHAQDVSYWLHYLYFAAGDQPPESCPGYMVDPITCRYRPDPLVSRIALGRSQPYENRERKHLHNVADVLPVEPLDGSIRKYTWWTPDYVLGCVQRQDTYPPESQLRHHPHHGGIPVDASQRQTRGYAFHQQHDWDLTLRGRTDARIFTHHPGPGGAHNEWTGDWGCGCGHFFQNRSALVALYDIPPGQPCQWIHAYVPRHAFDEIVEQANTVFVRRGSTFAALTLLPGYRWATEEKRRDLELICEGARCAAVCEAGTLGEFGSFADFRAEIARNPVAFDHEKMTLEYRSTRAGTLWLDTAGGRRLDGRDADLSYPAFDSPFMHSEWQSGVVELRYGDERRTLDFRIFSEDPSARLHVTPTS